MGILDKFRLDGKVALVTGAGRNLGREIALAFAESGADVIVTSRTLPEVEKTAADIRALGRRSMALRLDVTDLAAVQAAVDRFAAEFGTIDILVNNSATRSHKSIIDLSEAEWRGVIDTNLTGAFFCCKAVAPLMIRQKGGRIINISSRSGVRGRANLSAYCSSKGGLEQLTRALALEFAPHNILVNAIAPGLLNTDNIPKVTPAALEARTSKIPLRRTADLAEITPLALYLASPACTYVTGESILIDGGTAWQ
jgi:NAD(P)-dependent dehydrogenase (short-subunit alcohol dehydrogenase family)